MIEKEQKKELSFSTLKTKDVINVNDGHRLGKTKDLVFTWPEGKILGIVVPGSAGLVCFSKKELFIDIRCIVKIGDDVVLVNIRSDVPKQEGCFPPSKTDRRCSYDDYE